MNVVGINIYLVRIHRIISIPNDGSLLDGELNHPRNDPGYENTTLPLSYEVIVGICVIKYISK